VLSIAAALNQKRAGAAEDWEWLGGLCEHSRDFRDYFSDGWRFGTGTSKTNVEDQRVFIASEASLWLRLGRVGSRVWPADGVDPGVRIVVDYAFSALGAIAFQLALTISAAESFLTCSGCGVPYLRKKKRPKPGESNFCES
jgi:hypothetical protein